MTDTSHPSPADGEPSTTGGGVSFEPFKVEDAATEAVLDADGVGIRAPSHTDGALLWEITRQAGTLEVYGKPAGFVTAHRLPDRPDVLFVWQVAVLSEFRGLGIAKRLLNDILDRDATAGARCATT